jgi:hypothetical protein
VDWRAIGRTLVLLPPNWALVAGLALNPLEPDLPGLVERPLELAAAATLPLVMIYAGLELEVRGIGRVWREVAFAAVTRLVLGGLLGLAIGLALGLEGAELDTVVLLAAMPTAMMSLVIGARYRLRAEMIAAAVVVTTLLATLTLPLLRALLT